MTRSSVTPRGIWTKGAGITFDGGSPLICPRVARSHSSGFAGSRLRPKPPSTSTMSIGGIRACRPRARTDLPVPRPPAITTPPRPGSTAASISASLSVPWPVIAARGKARVARSSFTSALLATSSPTAAPLAASSFTTAPLATTGACRAARVLESMLAVGRRPVRGAPPSAPSAVTNLEAPPPLRSDTEASALKATDTIKAPGPKLQRDGRAAPRAELCCI
mmetsp:Transcript_7957/g.22369  ORF Transcript_7957/g.22369 Transcript_7957/m.22369 type:complete len:221 (+) Transcript_7957:409-1071(+)